MIEVEVKVSVRDKEIIIKKLYEHGFVKKDYICETDIYFDTEEDLIRKNDNALRIRSSKNLTTHEIHHYITYKGPKLDAISMTRQELETEIEDMEVMKELLKALGYVKTYTVIKSRQYFSNGTVSACIDSVNNLGEFLELEMVVQEAEKEFALDNIIEFLEQIGYCRDEIIRTSYLSMLQKRREI